MTFPKLLITGCRGLIGTTLWDNLADTFELFGLDISPNEDSEKVFHGDISSLAEVQGIFNRIPGLHYVVHLAGDARMDADWDSVFKNNIAGTRNVYEAAHTSGVARVILASSNHVTGGYEGIPPTLHEQSSPARITTRDPIRPDGFYGVSKAAGEAIARMYYEVYGLESICLRIGSFTREDDPALNPRYKSTWLSHRDLVQLVRKSLFTKQKFGIYYGVSNNRDRFWDISIAQAELGYRPEDDASSSLMKKNK
jgi:nucleoside-diphosphate-sugar epimerase